LEFLRGTATRTQEPLQQRALNFSFFY
jgi:hypothetical protein